MSLNRSCDRCGRFVEDKEDKEYFDMEIFIGGKEEPIFCAEDLCEPCMEFMMNQIKNTISKKLNRESPTKRSEEDGTQCPQE